MSWKILFEDQVISSDILPHGHILGCNLLMCASNMLKEIAQLAIMLICVSNTATIQQTQQHVAGNKCCSNIMLPSV